MRYGTRMIGMAVLCFMHLLVHGQEWNLVWSDEFEGNVLDTSKWSFQTGTGTEYGLTDWGNSELEYYREENVTVEDGSLVITAKKEAFGGKQYTSGRIRTLGRGDWTYGRIEFRAKMPVGKGLWAAVWMLPSVDVYGGWAASGEIDIMEYLGQEPWVIHGTLHFGNTWPNNQQNGTSYTVPGTALSSEFRDYALEWEEGAFRWYVDGTNYLTLGESDWWSVNGAFPAPFDVPFHLLVNLAVGGNWPGPPDGSAFFPQTLSLDFIRVYQKGPVGMESQMSPEQSLRLNPNPATWNTRIRFSMERAADVTLELVEPSGRPVLTICKRSFDKGHYQMEADLSGLPPGYYLCRMDAGDRILLKPLIIL